VLPWPARVKGVPDTMLKGAPTVALPEIVPPLVFDTVKLCSTKLPRATVPKLTEPVGLTPNSARETALATFEHGLSAPAASIALTATLYVAPVVSPVSLRLTRWPALGLDVGEAIDAHEDPVQGEPDVP